MNDHELSQALGRLVAERKRSAVPPELSRKVWVIPETAPRQRTWLPPIPTWRFQSMFTATKFVVAGVVVALFGGLVLSQGLTSPPIDEPALLGASTSPMASTAAETLAPTATAQPVEALWSGVIDTPAGRIEWTRVPHAELPLPKNFSVRDRGFRLQDVMSWHGDSFATVQGSKAWRSDDGTEWQSLTLPAKIPQNRSASWLTYDDGVSWFVISRSEDFRVTDPDRVVRAWRSTDGTTWEQIDTSKWGLPAPARFPWSLEAGSVVGTDAFVVLSQRLTTEFPVDDFFEVRCSPVKGLQMEGKGLYRVLHRSGCRSDGRLLELVEFDGGVRVFEARTDKRLGVLPGVKLADIDKLIKGRHVFRIHGIDATGLQPTNEPGRDLSGDDPGTVSLFAADGAVYRYEAGDDGAPISVWRTTDGSSWEDMGPLGLPEGRMATWIDPSPSHVVATSCPPGGQCQQFLSIDGEAWEPEPSGAPENTWVTSTGNAWLARGILPGYRGDPGDQMWIHAGDEWISLNELGFSCAEEGGRSRTSVDAANGTVFILAKPGCKTARKVQEDLWILKPAWATD